MDVFGLRNNLIRDYEEYIKSFFVIRDDRIRAEVNRHLADGELWPDPLIQLNPSFERGHTIEELVADGVLHEECRGIFRVGKTETGGGTMLRLHRHQEEAIRMAAGGHNYVLTTGTGSGKSLAYMVPIVDHVLRSGSGKGLRAIVIYPMNALANSQKGELEKFLKLGMPAGSPRVTFERYTGQEGEEERQRILASPPDILLTNFVMLELILTRPRERPFVQNGKLLRFMVLDELHTYRGRQGADVAMLVRRMREAFGVAELQCVGTSATLAGPGSAEEQRNEVARVATQLFGSAVKPEHVVGETLTRATPARDFTSGQGRNDLRRRVEKGPAKPVATYAAFLEDPLSSWIEGELGLVLEKGGTRLLRAEPRSLSGEGGAAALLAQATGAEEMACGQAIEAHLLASYHPEVADPETSFPPFAFRLHQFMSRGDTVHASLELEDVRYLTLLGQQYVPGDRGRILLPLVFCRECGQEYYCVHLQTGLGGLTAVPRQLGDIVRGENTERESGFLYLSADNPWPDDPEAILERVPEEWLEERRGGMQVKASQRKSLPRRMSVGTDGAEASGSIATSFIPAPFRFCLRCGVSYGSSRMGDYTKLATLATEGRSTATTILSLSAIRHLKRDGSLPADAQKLLSFTDNRQDASLQAGHFNDFVEVGLMRAALYRAVSTAGPDGVSHDELEQRVFLALKSMGVTDGHYAREPGLKGAAAVATDAALRGALSYRIYRDQERGWRITAPNLEQCGLLAVDYLSLPELCTDTEVWQDKHEALVSATPAVRDRLCRILLAFMRQELAIRVDALDPVAQERIKSQSDQRLGPPWGIDENETMERGRIVFPRSRRPREEEGTVCMSARSGFGQLLRRPATFPAHAGRLSLQDTDVVIKDLLKALSRYGLVESVHQDDDIPGYQVPAGALIWKAGDGKTPLRDPIRMPRMAEGGGRTNPFFVRLYREVAQEALGLEAREHTAQVQPELRQEREEAFKTGKLPVLYCSATMELGVDIARLNVVNMRNVPPTPANYAQRSGRAGRSGQPALVFSYCSTFRSHDQYFFRRPLLMVAGSVTPPRIDLGNEDLVRSHVHSLWLTATQFQFDRSLSTILDCQGEDPTLEILPGVRDDLFAQRHRGTALAAARRIVESIRPDLAGAVWFTEKWCGEVLDRVPEAFDRACDRWRTLYRAAVRQQAAQNRVVLDASRSAGDKQKARALRAEAEQQIGLLAQSQNVMEADFYTYRYLASEGFLPGYSFPRLPLSAYVPARRSRTGRDEFISRPRFLAISEFGPRSFLYHEGARYRIDRVIMPLRQDPELVALQSAKICEACGYLHPIVDGPGPDNCEQCDALLPKTERSLFRLENVSTRRVDRINSDEEERVRFGYEIRTVLRFAEHAGERMERRAEATAADGSVLARLAYGPAATLWRINRGWSRRGADTAPGFTLDIERGYWGRNDQDEQDQDSPMSERTARVMPYVEDHRNALLFEPAIPEGEGAERFMPTLQAALKNALLATCQLEEDELAAEPLPSADNRRKILFYEAAEGGAGVLRRLVEDPQSLGSLATEALRILHYDPETGADLRRAPRAREDCEAACYDCLMSYTNQPDHRLLDRAVVKDALLLLRAAGVQASAGPRSRREHFEWLSRQCGSGLERRWLDFMHGHDLALPTSAQPLVAECSTRPDFLYADHQTAIYVDGPPHDDARRAERDAGQTTCMEDHGYMVIRFGHHDDWAAIVRRYPSVFGKLA